MNESLSRDIVMSSVHCDGMESYLIDCPASYVENTNCQSMAYVECTTESDELTMQEDIISKFISLLFSLLFWLSVLIVGFIIHIHVIVSYCCID